MKIGERLSSLRKNVGLDRDEVADKLEVSKSAIGSWETDQREPSYDMLDKLAELYGVTVPEIFSNEPQKENKVNLLDKIILDMHETGNLSVETDFDNLGETEKGLILSALKMHIKEVINN